MITLRDFVPGRAWQGRRMFLAAVAMLFLCMSASQLVSSLRTGIAQRLSSTPKYTRDGNPLMFWVLVVFSGSGVVLCAALLVGIILRWDDE